MSINKDLEGVYLYIKHAPRNPNVNGIYYDEESYKKALKKYEEDVKNRLGYVIYGYPVDKRYMTEHNIVSSFIGTIIDIGEDIVVIKPLINASIDVIKDIRKNQSDYWFGFTLEAEVKNNIAYISEIKSAHVFRAPEIKNIEIDYNDKEN